MIRLRHKLLIYGLRLFDQLVVAILLFTVIAHAKGVTDLWHIQLVLNRAYRLIDYLGLTFIAGCSMIVFSHFVRYEANRYVGIIEQITRLAKANTTVAFALILAAVVFKFETLSINGVVVFWGVSLVVGVLSRVALRRILSWARKSGQSRRHLLIVGVNESSLDLADRIEKSPELGYRIVAFIDKARDQDDCELPRRVNRYLNFSDLPAILENGTVDEVLICLPLTERLEDVERVIGLCRDIGIVARVFPDERRASFLSEMEIEQFEGDVVATFFRENLLFQLLVKRVTDILVSLVMLILLSPLFVTVAVAIKLTSKGPIFFAQERVGMNKRRFKLLKFRSMVIDAEKLKRQLMDKNEVDGPVFKIKDDPRVTRVGKLIRKTSIDELPQLINVLRGEMSLVGPRPPLPSEVDEYDWLFRKRLAIKPGITCLWQVMGRNTLSFDRWMELDKEYVENWSIWLDFKILLKTVPVVLTGHGAS